MTDKLRIGCGPFTAQARGHETPHSMAELVEQAVVAEQCGLDSVWLSEHHFFRDGYLGAVFPLLGAMAARTKRVLLGTRVALAPLYHPLRLAEDAAAVAGIGGRTFVLGLGAGYEKNEFAALGVPLAERGRRVEQAVEVCRRAWTGEPFSYTGVSVDVTELVCRPKPTHVPQLWLGGVARAALARTARLADGYCVPLGDAAATAKALGKLDALMPPGKPPLPVVTNQFVALTSSPAARSTEEGIKAVLATYSSAAGQSAPALRDRGVVIGGPDEVCEVLLEKHRAVGDARLHHLVVRLGFPGMSSAQVEDHIEAFARTVMPGLRERAA